MSDPTAPGNPLDEIIAEYIQAAEAGKVPSRQLLLDAHPEYADDLRAFFADFDRLDNRADALKLATTRPPAQRPKVRYLGDFELLEEIAEGGMGLVYKARQETLGRIVALKLVRAGQLAKPIDIARFRIEAEAAAGLDHPNIVPLYEVGEHEGQHYLAMKFIDGPSLAKLPRGSIKAEVARMEAIARAVDFAHHQGILHRDIKPSNILTDAAGTPYVTDFGLAKRIDAELSLTESGQMLGTAGYIAPEQALGKKGLTVTADVFSLGAVLFERLTGTPAFPGGTILERLRSLHESITPRPTLLMPTLPRDLETVCLKCLEREPGKRYGSAGAMADDLSRWLRGEPIVARRVTQLERFWLWCRRNPAVAGLTTGIGVLLVAITALSRYSAVEMKRRAVEADEAKEEALTAKSDALKAKDEALHAKDEAIEARSQAEKNRLDGLLRPIGYGNEENNPAEQYALLELAEMPDSFKLLFLETALREADTANRIARRGERVLHAAVGASEHRRKAILDMLLSKQRDKSQNAGIRVAACQFALRLGSTDLPAEEFGLWNNVLGSYEKDFFCNEQIRLFHTLGLRTLLAPPSGHTKLLGVQILQLVAARLGGPDAVRTCEKLIELLDRASEDEILTIVNCLSALAPHLDGPASVRVSDSLVRAIERYPKTALAWYMTNPLGILAASLDVLTCPPKVGPAEMRGMV